MRRSEYAFVLSQIVLLNALCYVAPAQNPFPRQLPPADKFRLTLREDPYSALSNEPSGTGEAGLTLTCRAFLFTLQNKSTKTVRLNSVCDEPQIGVYRKDSNTGWWPVSRPKLDACSTVKWKNVRLRPGETTEFATRLISAQRDGGPLFPSEYTLRANWTLFGCIDNSEDVDCLSPLQAIPPPPSSVAKIDFQEPVQVVSDEVVVQSPPLPDLGTMSFSFEVAMLRAGSDPSSVEPKCKGEDAVSIGCVVFHYTIRNTGARAVRYITASCSFSGIIPEYRAENSEWKRVPTRDWVCSRNITIEHPILPGETADGDFVLKSLPPGYDLTPLLVAGKYGLRFKFTPIAGFASPDGRFCLTRNSEQKDVLSNELSWELR